MNYQLMYSDFTIELGKGTNIQYHNSCSEIGWKVTLADTGLEAMTGARIKRIEKYIDTELFMLTYGDGVADINIKKLVDFHWTHKKIATVTGVHPSSRFGELILQGNMVKQFSEKPQTQESFINGGFFVFDKKLFKYVKDEDTCTFEREPLEQLSADDELVVFIHKGYWHCMDTYRDVAALNQQWKTGNAPWKVWK